MTAPTGGFGARLDYLQWLWVFRTRHFGSNRDFAAFAGVPYELFMKWRRSVRPPSNRDTAKAFVAKGLGDLGATEDWLIDGKGDPPHPLLWRLWSDPGAASSIPVESEVESEIAPATSPTKRAAVERRPDR